MQEKFFQSSAQALDHLLTAEISHTLPLPSSAPSPWLMPTLERSLAVLMIVIFSPLLIVCGLLVRLTSQGPAIYSQVRVGVNGSTFAIYKFRTMTEDAEAQTGPVLSSENDNRVTLIGKFLRNSHLDEIPQLLNIAKGEMSFIGPRPERPVFVETYRKTIPMYSLRERVKPGVTGLAQICLPYNASAEEKLAFDLRYIHQQGSMRVKLGILWYTLLKTLHVRFNR